MYEHWALTWDNVVVFDTAIVAATACSYPRTQEYTDNAGSILSTL
jgi:hypothetical protein